MPSNSSSKKNILYSLADIFGAYPTLNVHGGPRTFTRPGLCLTLGVLFLAMLALYEFSFDLWNHSNPVVSKIDILGGAHS